MQVNSPNLHRRQDEQVTKEEPKHKKLDTRSNPHENNQKHLFARVAKKIRKRERVLNSRGGKRCPN